MMLRFADHRDEENIYNLSNDIEVRKYSFNNSSFPYNEHKIWFENQLSDKNTIFYVAYENDNLIGQIRLKVANGEAVISISISPNYRGKGYGTKIMNDAIILLRKNNTIKRIKALVKSDNPISKNFFEKCGFQFIEQILHQGVKTDIYNTKLIGG